ncbi:MAG: hypothetical protein KBC00_03085, partial [Candidatus Levybacteria bacterium]|nr:hypothetical protein [Candidatus Levybacteria bacterium]
MDSKTKIADLGRSFSFQKKKLEKLGLNTIYDLFYHIPSRYEDLRIISKINKIQPGETITVQGKVLSIKNEYRTRRMIIQKAILEDETGEIEIRWFNQTYLTRNIPQGSTLSVSGTASQFGKTLAITAKEFEVMDNLPQTIHTGRIVPVYP